MLRSAPIGRAWMLAATILVGGCDGSAPSPSVTRCEMWARDVRGTLRETPGMIATQAEIKGHCSGAEDHIISGCALLAPEGRRDRALGFTEAYEEACRAGRRGGMRDPDASPEQRAAAWREALEGVSDAFDGVLGTFE